METETSEILEDLGLSDKEIKVYFALLNLGEATASRISEIANLNRITTYTLLKSMTEKGFCSTYDKNKIQYFRPLKPENILGLLEEKKKKISLILPILKQQEKKVEEKPEVAIFEGKKGIAALMTLILDDAEKIKEVLGYGNVTAGEKGIGSQSYYWRKSRLERKIKMRAVSDSLGDIEHRSPPEWKKLTEVRTNKTLASNNTYTIIAENILGIFIPSEEPIAIMIKNRQVVEKEKFFFDLLWKAAK
jgi:sugar-specific transcriptional regulator TrmB